MTTLVPKPPAASGVGYVLTVPQSVLFTHMSMQGNARPVFKAVFGIDYEPEYVEYDDGALSWNIGATDPFVQLLTDGLDLAAALERFIAIVGQTSRNVERTSRVLCEGVRQPSDRPQLLEHFRAYWTVYEQHMTSLFTFWNLEVAVSDEIARILDELGRSDEADRFLTPAEPNYFMRERRRRTELIRHHVPAGKIPRSIEDVSPDFHNALDLHARFFGFFLTPFNVGVTSSPEMVLESLVDPRPGNDAGEAPIDHFDDFDPPTRRFARLARQLAFWKSERVDVMTLGDAYMANHYQIAARELGCSTATLFAMTRDELEAALESGECPTDASKVEKRKEGYCLVLDGGEISFYAPTDPSRPAASEAASKGSVLRGVAASAGVAWGPVRLIHQLSDLDDVLPGDVLVARMTRPEFGVALDHAAAFVTDDGGRLSHAAVIAREMKKPCVIATQDATRRLRDGLVVEVNGTDGIVTVRADAE